MKILFCLPGNEWGGPEREPVRTLARALTESGGVDVSFIQFSRETEEIARRANGSVVPCRASLSRSMLHRFQPERQRMADEIRRQQPDLVHVHWTQLGHALAAMDSGIPYVVTIHDAALTCAYWNWSWRLGPALCTLGGLVITRKILRQASHVVAVSPYVSDHVKRFFLPPGYSSISIIPNPVSLSDTSGFKFQVSNDSPVFAAIGHWGPLKNFSLALRAFALVRGSLPHAKLVLVGKDLGTGTPCHAWAVRHGLESGVDFRGPMAHADLMAFLSNDIDCLVHPARTEGFSLVVADAMAAGVPVVAAAAGALPWLLGNGAFGTLVDSRAPAPWAEAMIEAATGTGSSSLLERARERIASLCDPRRIAAQHMEVYARVVKRPGS